MAATNGRQQDKIATRGPLLQCICQPVATAGPFRSSGEIQSVQGAVGVFKRSRNDAGSEVFVRPVRIAAQLVNDERGSAIAEAANACHQDMPRVGECLRIDGVRHKIGGPEGAHNSRDPCVARAPAAFCRMQSKAVAARCFHQRVQCGMDPVGTKQGIGMCGGQGCHGGPRVVHARAVWRIAKQVHATASDGQAAHPLADDAYFASLAGGGQRGHEASQTGAHHDNVSCSAHAWLRPD